MSFVRVLLSLGLSCLCWVNSIRAEAPSVSAVVPAGGQRGQRVEVTVQGKLGSPPLSFWSDRPDLQAEFPEKLDKSFTVIIPESTPPGLALIRVYNAEGTSALRPFEIGTLSEVTEQEPNDSLDKSQTLDSSQKLINGVLNKSGDVDSYAVTLEQGQTLVAAISSNRVFGTPLDAVLQIVSPQGFVLEQNDDDRGNDPLIAFPVPEAGTYYVRTFGFPVAPDSSVRFSGGADWIYRLTLTTGPYVDHLQPLSIPAGSETSARVFGWNLSDTTNQISLHQEPGVSEILVPGSANVVEVAAVAYPTIAEPFQDAPPVTSIPVCFCGQIENPGEIDTIRIAGKKGVAISCRVEAYDLGSQLDPVLRLVNAEGKQLDEVDDASRGDFDPTLKYTPKSDGELVLQIRDRFEHGGMRYYYRVTISPPQKDFTLAVAADAFKQDGDKPLEIPVTIDRDRGFDDELEIHLEGLPEGVVSTAVVSEKKGDSAKKVNLKIERGTIESFAGPIQIVGTSTGDSKIIARAQIAVAGTSRLSNRLWLTIPAKPAEPKKDENK
jgi:Bacterial pre-peptidase C-terminal domain